MSKHINDDRLDVPDDLLEYVEEAAGAHLRGVVHYDKDDFEAEITEDIDEAYTETELREIVEEFRLTDIETNRHESLYVVGDLYCTLRAFDDALILHLLQDEDRGTIVSVSPEAAPELTEFIYGTLKQLDETSESTLPRAPTWAKESS